MRVCQNLREGDLRTYHSAFHPPSWTTPGMQMRHNVHLSPCLSQIQIRLREREDYKALSIQPQTSPEIHGCFRFQGSSRRIERMEARKEVTEASMLEIPAEWQHHDMIVD
jgi:hypothetical protein